jgi:hypothetical protein
LSTPDGCLLTGILSRKEIDSSTVQIELIKSF